MTYNRGAIRSVFALAVSLHDVESGTRIGREKGPYAFDHSKRSISPDINQYPMQVGTG